MRGPLSNDDFDITQQVIEEAEKAPRPDISDIIKRRKQRYGDRIANPNNVSYQPWNDRRNKLLEPWKRIDPWKQRPSAPKLSPLRPTSPLAPIAKKLTSKGLIAIPVIGEIISGFQVAEDISNLAKDVDLIITQSLGLPFGEIDIQQLIEGKKDEEEPPPPTPLPPPIPPPGIPSPTDYPPIFPPLSPTPTKGEGWHRAKINIEVYYAKNVFYVGPERYGDFLRTDISQVVSTGYVWFLGPIYNFEREQRFWQYSENDWAADVNYFLGAMGAAKEDPSRPGEPPLSNNPNSIYRPSIYPVPTKIRLLNLGNLVGIGPPDIAGDYYSGGRIYIPFGDVKVSISWVPAQIGKDGSPYSPPFKPFYKQDDDDMPCPVNLANQMAIQNNITNAINNQTTNIQNIVNNSTTNTTSIQNIQSTVNNLQTTTSNIQNTVNNVQTTTNNVQNVVNNIQSTTNNITTKLQEGFDLIKAEIQKVLQNLEKLGKWLKLDKIVNLLTLAMTIHNAAMLSNNLFQSAMSAIGNLLTFLGNAAGLRDVNDEPIDITETVGDTIENLINSVFGAGNVTAAKKAWQSFSTIYQAASNVLLAVQSLANVVHGLLEVCNERVALIGNALKKWGAISEKAYGWMNPYAATTNRFTTFVQNSEDIVSQVDMAAMEATEGQQILNELPNQIEALQKSLRQDEGSTQKAPAPEAQATKVVEQTSKANSQSPDITNSDLVNSED